MTPTKILIGQMLMVFGIVVGGSWLATEWTAAQLGFQQRLGAPWFQVLKFPVYLPWRFAEWWYVYESYAPDIFTRGGEIAASSGLLAAFSAVLGSVWRARQSKLVATYGSARWASLMPDHGFYRLFERTTQEISIRLIAIHCIQECMRSVTLGGMATARAKCDDRRRGVAATAHVGVMLVQCQIRTFEGK